MAQKDDNSPPKITQAVLTDNEADEAEPNYLVLPKDKFPYNENAECQDVPNAEGTDGWNPAHTHKGEQANVKWGKY